MIWTSGIILLVYGSIIFMLIRGAAQLNVFKPKNTAHKQHFSIVVPFRDEAGNLPKLLESLTILDYPKEHFEVILVDDFSTDDSQLIIDQFYTTGLRLKVLKNTESSGSPKKNALTIGVKNAKNRWIVTTDADCVVPKNWLSLFDAYIAAHRPNFISAPVMYKAESGFFQYFQQLDFLALQGTTMGGFGLNKPFLCNGANMCYNKHFFLELGGYSGNEHISSGDDVFLMEKFLARDPDKVQFLKNSRAIVTTLPVADWNTFLQQRIRWAGKTSALKNGSVLAIGTLVFIVNFWVLLLVIASLTTFVKPLYFLVFFIVKWLIDIVFLYKIGRFYGISPNIPTTLLSSLLYPFYIFFVTVWSLKGGYRWKDRDY